MFWKLPPVRRPVPIHVRHDDKRGLGPDFAGFASRLYGSGTQALACALEDSRRRIMPSGAAEAILPAYGCPDLVAACLRAGVRPVLVDIAKNAWGYDPQQLQAALRPQTVAIVAVNLLGAGDQGEFLAVVTKARGIPLIQDSAQYLPDSLDVFWHGDYVVFSFGRGKPLNLMQGGMLLVRDSESWTLPPGRSDPAPSMRRRVLASAPAAMAFNLATHPAIYWLTSRLPGLGVGETRYSPLESCQEMGPDWRQRLNHALYRYRRESNYSAAKWLPTIQSWQHLGIGLLQCAQDVKADAQYLRLPLLARTGEQRDRLLQGLQQAGMGASAMYRIPLNRIGGIPATVAAQGPFPAAEDIAARLFTLPTHSLVGAPAIGRIDAIVRACVAD